MDSRPAVEGRDEGKNADVTDVIVLVGHTHLF